jgi:hypothetical protein
MNFTQVKEDLEDMQADRAEQLREAKHIWAQAEQRVDYATPSHDMRLWTREEREEYQSAVEAAFEAWKAYQKAMEAL